MKVYICICAVMLWLAISFDASADDASVCDLARNLWGEWSLEAEMLEISAKRFGKSMEAQRGHTREITKDIFNTVAKESIMVTDKTYILYDWLVINCGVQPR